MDTATGLGIKELDDCTLDEILHDPHRLGMLGEELAQLYLSGKGFEILEHSRHTSYGEADLVCRFENEIVLIEVKTRMGEDVLPEEAVDAKKMRRYRNMTLDYLRQHEDADDVRFDVIALNIIAPRTARVHHFIGVCTWES